MLGGVPVHAPRKHSANCTTGLTGLWRKASEGCPPSDLAIRLNVPNVRLQVIGAVGD